VEVTIQSTVQSIDSYEGCGQSEVTHSTVQSDSYEGCSRSVTPFSPAFLRAVRLVQLFQVRSVVTDASPPAQLVSCSHAPPGTDQCCPHRQTPAQTMQHNTINYKFLYTLMRNEQSPKWATIEITFQSSVVFSYAHFVLDNFWITWWQFRYLQTSRHRSCRENLTHTITTTLLRHTTWPLCYAIVPSRLHPGFSPWIDPFNNLSIHMSK